MATAFALREAARHLRSGGLLAYPTEAIYGLGCDPLNAGAVARLLALKQRPQSKGLILVAASVEQLMPYIDCSLPQVLRPALATWPGPHTWILPARQNLPTWISGSHSGLAVRVSAHPLVRQLCLAFGGALVSTSANLSGQQPARNALQVKLKIKQGIKILNGKTGGLKNATPIRSALDGSAIRS